MSERLEAARARSAAIDAGRSFVLGVLSVVLPLLSFIAAYAFKTGLGADIGAYLYWAGPLLGTAAVVLAVISLRKKVADPRKKALLGLGLGGLGLLITVGSILWVLFVVLNG